MRTDWLVLGIALGLGYMAYFSFFEALLPALLRPYLGRNTPEHSRNISFHPPFLSSVHFVWFSQLMSNVHLAPNETIEYPSLSSISMICFAFLAIVYKH